MMLFTDPEDKSGRPAKPSGLFDPICASCGKADLNTTSGTHSGGHAGYCPSCGVFIGFECCARKSGWKDWKRLCPACGTRLRTNNLLLLLVAFSFGFLLVGLIFAPNPFVLIDEGNAERVQVDMPVTDPGQVHPGDPIKISGTVAGLKEIPISGTSRNSGKTSHFVWTAYDFEINYTNGTILVLASKLSNTELTTGQIIGSDGHKGAYHVGDAIVVIGVVSGVSPQIVIEPLRIAPDSAAFDRGLVAQGWDFIAFDISCLVVLIFALWPLMRRYLSHRRRIGDFKTGEMPRPIE